MALPVTLSVHRCRFVDYNPSAITALAFPPLPLPKSKGKKPIKNVKFGSLAVGHANGNIDLCEWTGSSNQVQSAQAWVVKKTLPGLYPSKVDSLVFALKDPDEIQEDSVPELTDLRLFSSGGGSELLEWDIGRSCIRRTISSQSGSIWSVSANPASTKIALGCEDGTVHLLSIADDTLTHLRRLDRVKSRLLSICWGPPVPHRSEDSEEVEWTDSWLVTGGSDSSIRKWDLSSGRVLDKMTTEKMRGERTLVWAVTTLGDGTIISGDSLGTVKFWDSRTCTQLQSFKAHGADILCLTVGPDGSTVYSSGVDQKVTQFSLVKTANAEQSTTTQSRWIQGASRRLHSHDVRGLVIWPPYTLLPPSYKRRFPIDVAPILASGGLDMSVVLTPAALPSSTTVKVINPLMTSTDATFDDSYHRRLAYPTAPSGTSGLRIARKARLLSCMRESGFTIWKILSKNPPDDAPVEEETYEDVPKGGWEKVLEMELSVQSNLIASDISDDGRWLAASDLYETKLFQLESDPRGTLKPKRIKDFAVHLKNHLPDFNTGSVALAFTPDSTKLVMSTAMSSYIVVLDLRQMEVIRRFDTHRHRDPLRRIVRVRKTGDGDSDVEMAEPEDDSDDSSEASYPNVSRLSVSPDGQWLATSDEQGHTHVYNLDSVQHHCTLPSFPTQTQSISFDFANPSILMLSFANNTFQIYDVETRQFPSWSKALCSHLPKRLLHMHEPLLGIVFDPDVGKRYALLWGSTWLCKIRLDGSVLNPADFGNNNKRRRDQIAEQPQEDQQDLKMITHYRPILKVDFLSPGELVLVERPLVDVLATLPPAYFRHKYGAT